MNKDIAEQTIRDILTEASQKGVSEVHLAAGVPVVFRMPDGRLDRPDNRPLTTEDIMDLSLCLLDQAQQEALRRERDSDTSYFIPGIGNFRINLSYNRGAFGASIRVLPPVPKTIRELHLPLILESIASHEKGLVLITGGASEGKSTTMAAMIQYLNTSNDELTKDRRHIVTMENPIEYTFESRNALIRQREIGRDVISFGRGLAAATREDVDVIAIGEMRDSESTEAAMQAAIRGQLVISTAQANSIDEIPSLFQRDNRRSLAFALRAIVYQQLLPSLKGGKVACCQVLIASPGMANLIMGNDIHHKLSSLVAQSKAGLATRMVDSAKDLYEHRDKNDRRDPLISEATLNEILHKYKGQ
ncbi:MAG: ATPase, T2SS/T4P/T4SS family [bacterium]